MAMNSVIKSAVVNKLQEDLFKLNTELANEMLEEVDEWPDDWGDMGTTVAEAIEDITAEFTERLNLLLPS